MSGRGARERKKVSEKQKTLPRRKVLALAFIGSILQECLYATRFLAATVSCAGSGLEMHEERYSFYLK